MLFPDYPTTFWLTAVLTITLVGISKVGFGGGTALQLILGQNLLSLFFN